MALSFDLATLLAFALTSTLLNITPGPAVLRTIGDAIQHGAGAAQATIFGILGANAMYCLATVLGLGALIHALPSLFIVIKWIGVAYLVWLGLNALKSAWHGPPPGAVHVPVRADRLFMRSFLLQAANPKSILFFGAMLPVFAGEAEGAPLRILVLGVVALVMEYPVLLGYALLGSKVLALARTPAMRRVTDGLGGIALLGAAVMVARASFEKR